MDKAQLDRMLTEMNQLLQRTHEQHYERHDTGQHPLVFIIGVPRSGTTLMSQLAAFSLNVSYVNNLVAAFWSSPLYGIALAQKVMSSVDQRPSFRSQYGRTHGVGEPHEYGYFWKELFRYDMRFQQPLDIEGEIDWDRIQQALRNLAHAYGEAVTFKYLPLCWHIVGLKEILPEALFVRVRRDPFESARSLIHFRAREFGSNDYMASLIPEEARALEERPYWVQVAGQVFYIDKILDDQLADIPPADVMNVDYEELCSDPQRTVKRLASLLVQKGYPARIELQPPSRFEISYKSLEPKIEANIRSALEEFYGPVEEDVSKT